MQNRRLVVWIVLGVFVWGAIHALGAYLNFREFDSPWRVWRAVMVLLCVEAFLGFWLVMLGLRRRASNRRSRAYLAHRQRDLDGAPPTSSATVSGTARDHRPSSR
jgi:4-amino-4-deoxy-L-arabinose transferase-like glycosyltransferase